LCGTRRSRSEGTAIAYTAPSCRPSTISNLFLALAKHSRTYAWLAGFDGHSLQQGCPNLDRAFTNFFEGRARFPRFKRKHGSQASYHCTGKIKVGAD
jgi:transposase